MGRWTRAPLLFAVLLLLARCAATPEGPPPSGEILDYGIYAHAPDAGTLRENPAATGGVTREGLQTRLVVRTDRVPLIKDILFGFSYALSNLPDGEVDLEWKVVHPRMIKPDGTTSTGYSYPRTLTVEEGRAMGRNGYSLTETYEMVPGRWVFSYSYGGQVLVEQSFEVFLP